jgi:hypothetical protein
MRHQELDVVPPVETLFMGYWESIQAHLRLAGTTGEKWPDHFRGHFYILTKYVLEATLEMSQRSQAQHEGMLEFVAHLRQLHGDVATDQLAWQRERDAQRAQRKPLWLRLYRRLRQHL